MFEENYISLPFRFAWAKIRRKLFQSTVPYVLGINSEKVGSTFGSVFRWRHAVSHVPGTVGGGSVRVLGMKGHAV